MSYLVLARKYRPRSFDAMVGQEHVVRALVNALTRQRLHHAYLFAGTRGVGKTTVSRVLAKALNCTGADGRGGITATPCGVCAACCDIDSGRFVDYVELDAASNRGVDEITQLLDQAVYKPVIGRFKVYMIDEVHMLSNHAFNAMLKTLEEPPEYLKFVLATTDPQKVPPTVLSRCLQFNLRPMAPHTMQAHLAGVLAAEGIASEPTALRLLSRAARGSMRDALSLADQAIAYGAGALEEAAVRQMLGAVDRSHAVRLLAALGSRDGAALVEAADALRALGLSAAGTLEEMADLLQQIAVVRAVPQSVDDDEVDPQALLRLADSIAADEIHLFYGMCLHGRAELVLAPDEHSGLLMVLLRMLAFRPAQSAGTGPPWDRTPAASQATATSARAAAPLLAPNAAKASVVAKAVEAKSTSQRSASPTPLAQREERPRGVVDAAVDPPAGCAEEPPPWLDIPPDASKTGLVAEPPAESLVGARPDIANPVAAAAQARPPQPDRASPADRWSEVVMALCADGRVGALTRELALHAECVAIDDDGVQTVWRLRVERDTLRAEIHCDKLEKALADHLQAPLRLQVEPGVAADTPALRAERDRTSRQREAETLIREDPVVKSLLQQFKTARIVPGSIQPC